MTDKKEVENLEAMITPGNRLFRALQALDRPDVRANPNRYGVITEWRPSSGLPLMSS